ncbi:ArnT family glycosyltransferase [Dictyobacter aurantiacus]|uniref:Glycosyltransferase RgtA/B/C/D-like domain-containing protein n=1 Tax=Dictyobacter aurantiacus TaxID=1936993 RepID=A0A401ZHV8_9CHLR|nr:glycosyltransferase family 39 protein [Dictyobacter aurantiacus]GCE06429.1 hypothetical protein KDAU_37580 [Dictyobacter aurantiacus]
MKLDTRENVSVNAVDRSSTPLHRSLGALLGSWEVYLLLLVAAFLRLYHINTTEFDGDQADIFYMAHNAVSHGHLVATSNIASIKIFNPPAIIYALMIPAAFSANPLWGAVLTALLAIASVLLTYFLMRRYYGRLAATLASFLYATASVPIFYSRFMWNQNMLLFFVPLLIWFLYRGAVARRPFWLFPSVVLIGLLVQFHASSIVLVAPLLVALVLAPRRTVRWYDLVLSVLGILAIYAPYIVWLFQTHFQDIFIVLHTAKGKTLIDAQALLFYLQFLGPLPAPYTNKLSILSPYMTALAWLQPLVVLLVIAGAVLAAVLAMKSRRSEAEINTRRGFITGIGRWWHDLRQSPLRCGLLILLIWQIVPLLYLTRHDIVLHLHYFIMFMPGPFMLAGFFLARTFDWLHARLTGVQAARIAFLTISSLLVIAQFLIASGYVYDASHGRYIDTAWAGQYYNDLASLQNAMRQADQLAQQRHLNHVYVSADLGTQVSFLYLAGQMKTPTTVVDDSCLVLPGTQSGAAVLLTAPHSRRLDLVTAYAHAARVATAPHPGGPSFNLYVLQPGPLAAQSHDNFMQELKFMDLKSFNNGQRNVLASRWQMLRSAPAGYHTSYNYTFHNGVAGTGVTPASHSCSVSALRAGDQLIVPMGDPAQPPTKMQVTAYATLPTILSYNFLGAIPLQLDTFQRYDTPKQMLRSQSGLDYIPVSFAKKS